MKLVRIALLVVSISPLFTRAFAHQTPTTKPSAPAADNAGGAKLTAADEEPIITRVRVMQSKPCTYFYATAETTINDLPTTIPQLWQSLQEHINSGAVRPVGPVMSVYHGVTQDRAKPFQLELGIPVGDDQKEIGDFKVRKVEPMKNANVIYSGQMMQIGNGYQQLFTEIFAQGMQPTGETREMYLHIEGVNANGNVILLMAGVK